MRAWLAFVATLVVLAACAPAEDQAAQPEAPDPASEPEPQPEAEPEREPAPEEPEGWADGDVEYLLAVIDAEGPVEPDDPAIEDYAAALDAAETRCQQDRQEVANMAVGAHQILHEEGHDVTVMDVLVGVDEAVPEALAPADCAEMLATLMALLQRQD